MVGARRRLAELCEGAIAWSAPFGAVGSGIERGSAGGARRIASVKILVVDDHPLVRDAIASLLAQLDSTMTVLQASECASALALVRAHSDIDLVVLDLHLPGTRGFDALDLLRLEQPAMPVVILSMAHDRATVLRAIKHGAMGFIPKLAAKDVILNAARLVLSGGVYLPPEAIADGDGRLAESIDRIPPQQGPRSQSELALTRRQGQVLALVMEGKSNKEICRVLGLAERTVKVHVTAVLNALAVSTRTQAVIAASRLGLTAEQLLAGDELIS